MTSQCNGSFFKDQLAQNFDLAAPGYEQHATLQKYTASELIDRIRVMNIRPTTILDLGSGTGIVSKHLAEAFKDSIIVQTDVSFGMLCQARDLRPHKYSKMSLYLCADAEQMPFINNTFDLVVSNLMLQWTENLKTLFEDISKLLKPGGVFVFTTLGPSTLVELREAWAAADDLKHVNDFIDMHVVGDALIASGLADPIMETDNVILNFESVGQVMQHLKNLGANNINRGRRNTLTGKGRLKVLMDAYESRRNNHGLPCTYEVVYGHAWKPGDAGPKPNAGRHTISLDALKATLTRISGNKP